MADLEEFMNFRAETQRTLIRTTGVVRIRCMLKQGKENERDVVSTYSSIYIMPCSIALAIAMLDRGKPHPILYPDGPSSGPTLRRHYVLVVVLNDRDSGPWSSSNGEHPNNTPLYRISLFVQSFFTGCMCNERPSPTDERRLRRLKSLS